MQLEAEGYDVVSTMDGEEAISKFDASIQLAILDIMVPLKDGFEVLDYIRKDSIIPVIFLPLFSAMFLI